MNLRDIMLVSEPEACALYVIRLLKEQGEDWVKKVKETSSNPSPDANSCLQDESFICCDAGGGTIVSREFFAYVSI